MTSATAAAPIRALIGALAAALLAVGAIVAAPAPAEAAENPPGTAIYHPIDLYVYAEAGETIILDFEKVQGNAQVTFEIDGPGGVLTPCDMSGPGAACHYGVSVTADGIWRVRYTTSVTPDADDTSSIWSIVVESGGVPVPGRVWTEEYEMSNRDFTTTESFTFWYLGEFGDLYRVDYADFNGVNSTFTASGVGLVRLSGATCVPQYRSSQRDGELNPSDSSAPLRPLAAGECGGRYKLFFETPDASMPAQATYWNGATTWLYPPVVDPTVSNVSFAFDGNHSATGTLSFRVDDFQGTLNILVDVNDDGDADDAVDRVIPYFVSSLAPPTHTYAFDGEDGQGNPIPGEQPITFTISIDRAGEVHFVNTDVETRGGMQIESLRGPNLGDDRLYWDDRVFAGAVSADKCSDTTLLDGRTGVATGGGPQHGWDACVDPLITPVNAPPTNRNNGSHGSWGDSRHIHDWTFRTVSVSASAQVTTLKILPPTGSDAGTPTLVAGALLLGGLVLLAARRALTRAGEPSRGKRR